MSAPPSPRVFLLYSHDSPEHASQVLLLYERLRADGVDATLGPYPPPHTSHHPSWWESELDNADFVLLVCSIPFCQLLTVQAVSPDHDRGNAPDRIRQLLAAPPTRRPRCIPILLGT